MTRGVINRGRRLKKQLGQILANPRVYPLLPWLIILSALMMSTYSRAQGFENTTTGTVESRGGLSPEEIKLLDKESQKQMERYIKGRASSSEDLGSRYSGSLELHDSNFDGISDHGNSANDLEGGLEEASIGKRGLPATIERRKKQLEEKRKQLETALGRKCTPQNPCVNDDGRPIVVYRDGTSNMDVFADGTSANIVDVGPAHGKDNPKEQEFVKHRVYDITQKAKDAAQKTGENYARRALYEGVDYKITNPDRVRRLTNRKDEIDVLTILPDGSKKWVRTKVATDIDVVKSEVAWLEDQKERRIQNDWKFRRAKRMAGDALPDETELGETISAIYQKNKGGQTQAEDQKLAALVADIRMLSNKSVCVSPDGSTVAAPDPQNPLKCPATFGNVKPIRAESYTEQNKDKIQGPTKRAFYDKVRNLGLSKEEVQVRNKAIQEFSTCLKQDAWCDFNGSALTNKNYGKDLATVKGADIGDAYTDTREYINNRMERANLGPLNSMSNAMTNLDFNASIDQKAKVSQSFQEYQKQVAAAKKAWAELIAQEKEKERIYPWYKSPYRQSDANRMSARQLFERNVARGDGTTLVDANGNPISRTPSQVSQPTSNFRAPSPQLQPQR
jgi:hypothetical protein